MQLSLKEILMNITTWISKTSGSKVIKNSGSVTVNAAQTYNVCTITLPADQEYLIMGQTATNYGGSISTAAFMSQSNLAEWVYAYGRSTTGSGQGTIAWAYAKTGLTSATVTLQCYGYYTTSHTETGKIIAIPLSYLGMGSAIISQINSTTTSVDQVVLTPATNWDHYDEVRKLTVRKQGNVVCLHGALKNTATLTIDAYGTNSYLMTTLPERFRPKAHIHVLCQGSGACIWLCDVYTDGTVRMERYRDVVASSTPTSLAQGAWFPIQITWILPNS